MKPERRALVLVIQNLERIAVLSRQATDEAERALELARNTYAYCYGLYPLPDDPPLPPPRNPSR